MSHAVSPRGSHAVFTSANILCTAAGFKMMTGGTTRAPSRLMVLASNARRSDAIGTNAHVFSTLFIFEVKTSLTRSARHRSMGIACISGGANPVGTSTNVFNTGAIIQVIAGITLTTERLTVICAIQSRSTSPMGTIALVFVTSNSIAMVPRRTITAFSSRTRCRYVQTRNAVIKTGGRRTAIDVFAAGFAFVTLRTNTQKAIHLIFAIAFILTRVGAAIVNIRLAIIALVPCKA